jgi:Tol biopolymer transport system component
VKTTIGSVGCAVLLALCAGEAAASHESFPSAFDPSWSPDGRIVYVQAAKGGAGADIHTMNADGSRQRRLFAAPGTEHDPHWSPDGSRLVFWSSSDDEDEASQIYVATADGSTITRLTDSPDDVFTPQWSPDGTQIVYATYRDEQYQVWVMSAEGTNQRRLVVDDEDDADPEWSPDGTRIAFVGGQEDEGFIDVVTLATGERRRLTTSGSDWSPSWTAEGRLLFVSWAGDDPTILSVDGNGGDLRSFGDLGEGLDDPALSPDGSTLLYEATNTSERQIYVARVEGRGYRRLTGMPRVLAENGDRCTIIGTPGRDVLVGTRANDVICGLGGDDVLRGGGGYDTLDGGAGNDTIDGGAADDLLFGGRGADLLHARDRRRDRLDGGAGTDRAECDVADWVTLVERF